MSTRDTVSFSQCHLWGIWSCCERRALGLRVNVLCELCLLQLLDAFGNDWANKCFQKCDGKAKIGPWQWVKAPYCPAVRMLADTQIGLLAQGRRETYTSMHPSALIMLMQAYRSDRLIRGCSLAHFCSHADWLNFQSTCLSVHTPACLPLLCYAVLGDWTQICCSIPIPCFVF